MSATAISPALDSTPLTSAPDRASFYGNRQEKSFGFMRKALLLVSFLALSLSAAWSFNGPHIPAIVAAVWVCGCTLALWTVRAARQWAEVLVASTCTLALLILPLIAEGGYQESRDSLEYCNSLGPGLHVVLDNGTSMLNLGNSTVPSIARGMRWDYCSDAFMYDGYFRMFLPYIVWVNSTALVVLGLGLRYRFALAAVGIPGVLEVVLLIRWGLDTWEPANLHYLFVWTLVVMYVPGSVGILLTVYRTERLQFAEYCHRVKQTKEISRQATELSTKTKKISDMEARLQAATKLVDEVMQGGGPLIAAYSLRSDDIDYGDAKQRLGDGSFGVVYRAVFRGCHEVAVKTFRIGKVTSSELKKFKSEIIIMAPLRHPNLVRLFGGVWQEGADQLCIVLEFCANGSLDGFLTSKGSGYTWDHGLRAFALGVARGLSYLHHDLNEPLIHRDVKPANILVSADEVVKLADFGESTHFDAEAARLNSTTLNDALTMTMVGTRMYCAPEVLRMEKYNESVDTFSFSLVLLCLVAGDIRCIRKQYDGQSYHDGWRPNIEEELRKSASSVINLIESMWRADFRKRPAMEDVVRILSEAEVATSGGAAMAMLVREEGQDLGTFSSSSSVKIENASIAETQIILRGTIQKKDEEIATLQRENEDLKRRLLQRGDDAATTLTATMRAGTTERSLPPLQTIRAAATQRRNAGRGSRANASPAQPAAVPVASIRSSDVSAFTGMLRTMREAMEAPPSLALLEAAPTAELTLEDVLSNGGEAFGEVGEAFFPMLQKLHSDESTADFVEAFMVAHLPRGSEVLVPMLRQLLEPIARDVRSAARMATQGTVLRLVIGLGLTYGDLVTDVLMCLRLASEGSDLFGYAVAFIMLPLVMQAIAAVYIFQQGVTDVMFALLGLKPVVDSYRVWTGASAVEWHAFKTTPEAMLAFTKMIESAFEGFPQGALQLRYLITTPMEQWQALNFISLATSLGAIAFALTTGTIDVDRDEHLRRNAPWLYGFTGNAREATRGQRLARYSGLFLFYVGYLGAILLDLVAGASTNFSAVTAALVTIFGAYLGVKWWIGEFFLFTMPHQLWRRRSRYVISVLFHFFMLGFLLAAPAPVIRMPGFVNPHVFARAVLGNLLVFSPLCLLTFHVWPPKGCGGRSFYTLGEANQTFVDVPPSMSCLGSGDLFVAWACVASLSLVGMLWFWKYGMVRAYRGTFYEVKTYRSQTRKVFRNKLGNYGTNQSDALRATKQIITARDPSYWPEDLISTPVFKLAFPSWPEGRPEWMTEEWKRNLPSKWRGKFGFVLKKSDGDAGC